MTKQLKDVITVVDKSIEVTHHTNEDSAFAYAFDSHVDLFLVGIKPDDDSGYGFIRRISTIEEYEMTFFILISTKFDMKSIALEVFSCYDYFVKSLDEERLKKFLKKALKYEIVPRNPYITLTKDSRSTHILHRNIVWVDADTTTKETQFYLSNGSTTKTSYYRYPIRKVTTMLGRGFLLIHKSYIVNKAYTVDYRDKMVHLKGSGLTLPVGRSFVKAVRDYWERGK